MDLILKQVTPPSVEPVTLVQAKAHLRVDFSDDDTLITALITAARQYVENWTGRALITQTWRMSMDRFPGIVYVGRVPAYQPLTLQYPWWMPGVNAIYLLPCAVQAITNFQYYDGNGCLQTLTSDDYTIDTDSEPARVVPALGAIWPISQYRIASVQITLTAGYGADGTYVPGPLISAILLTIGDLYKYREAQTDMKVYSNATAERLMATYRIYQREVVE